MSLRKSQKKATSKWPAPQDFCTKFLPLSHCPTSLSGELLPDHVTSPFLSQVVLGQCFIITTERKLGKTTFKSQRFGNHAIVKLKIKEPGGTWQWGDT